MQLTPNQTSFAERIFAGIGDPLTYHPDSPRSDVATTAEKRELVSKLKALGAGLDPSDRKLIEVAADCALLAHCNQYRGGVNPPHVLSHILDVAQRTKAALMQDVQTRKVDPPLCSEVGIGVATAILHDVIEDFSRSIRRLNKDTAAAAKLISAFVMDELTTECGRVNAVAVLDRVRLLTLPNQEELPTTKYLEGIRSDRLAAVVKRSDMEHNYETFAAYSCVSPILIGGSQYFRYPDLYSPEIHHFAKALLPQLRADESCPWSPQNKTAEMLIASLLRYEGAYGLDRAYAYVRLLKDEVSTSCTTELTKLEQRLKDAIDTTNHYPLVTPELVKNSTVKGVAVRQVGPCTDWSSVTTISGGSEVVNTLKESIIAAAAQSGLHFPGYIQQHEGAVSFTMTRLPRRATEPMAKIADFERATEALRAELAALGITATVGQELPISAPLTAVMGLSEGYAEQRKQDLLSRMREGAITTVQQAEAIIEQVIGHETLARFGVSITGVKDLADLGARLSSRTLTNDHSIEEVQKLLHETDFTVSPGRIFSVKARALGEAGRPRVYEEEIALITGSNSEANFQKVVQVASLLGQARFSVQNRERLEARYIEVVQHCDTPSAMTAG